MAEARPDLVVTDLRMPGLDGLQLLEELRSRKVETPVIVLTGYASVDSAVEAMRSLAADDTLKPLISSEHATETVGDLDARKAALAKECPQLSGDDLYRVRVERGSDGAADKLVLDWLGPLPEFDEDVDMA